MKVSTFISVVGYVSRDEKNIPPFLTDLDRYLEQRFETYEIILVEDDSADAALADALTVKDELQGNVSIVSLRGRHGRESALEAGTDLSIGDYIFELDALSALTKPQDLVVMYDAAKAGGMDIGLGAKIRFASRRALYASAESKGTSRTQRYMNCGFNWAPAPDSAPGRSWGLDCTWEGFARLLYAQAILGFSAGTALAFFSETRQSGLMLLGFAIIQLGLAILHRRIQRLTSRADYIVREITRINRY